MIRFWLSLAVIAGALSRGLWASAPSVVTERVHPSPVLKQEELEGIRGTWHLKSMASGSYESFCPSDLDVLPEAGGRIRVVSSPYREYPEYSLVTFSRLSGARECQGRIGGQNAICTVSRWDGTTLTQREEVYSETEAGGLAVRAYRMSFKGSGGRKSLLEFGISFSTWAHARCYYER